MMSMVALGLLWSLIYNPLIGLISSLFNSLGITSNTDPINLLGDTRTAIYAAFAAAVWFNAGFSMVIFSAAIQGVPREIIESAITDGANKLQQIVFITIPYILRTTMLLIMVNMISGFKAFDILHVLTNGGPGLATNITSLYMYRQAFFAFKFDYASTMAVVLFMLTIVFVIVIGNMTDRIFKRFGH
jgi:ABC-type sugar transport system permease subunit